MSRYLGPYKFKLPKGHNFHPSYKFHKEQTIASNFWRNAYHQWNLLWVSARRNSELPKGVKKKVKKPKFDKDERHIWNN